MLNFRDIIKTTKDALGAILIQMGDALSGEVTSGDAEMYGPPGYVARPPDAIAGRAAQAITIQGPDREIMLGMRDLRGTEILGALKSGEFCTFAAGPYGTGQARIMGKDDGTLSSISQLTRVGNTADGAPVIRSMNSDGKIADLNENAYFTIDPDGTIKLGNKNGYIMIDADGNITLMGVQLTLAGQKVSLGNGASAATAAMTSQLPTPPLGVAPGSPIAGVMPSKSVFIAL